MSTYNLCFCGEIRKLSVDFGVKKKKVPCYLENGIKIKIRPIFLK